MKATRQPASAVLLRVAAAWRNVARGQPSDCGTADHGSLRERPAARGSTIEASATSDMMRGVGVISIVRTRTGGAPASPPPVPGHVQGQPQGEPPTKRPSAAE